MSKVSEQDQIVYEMYALILNQLKHYTKIQAQSRIFVTIWVLATLIVMGYVLLVFRSLLAISIISLASFAVIAMIAYKDIFITEKSIDNISNQASALEDKYDWLPKYFKTSSKINKLLKVNPKSFYMVFSLLILVLLLSVFIGFAILGKLMDISMIVPFSVLACQFGYLFFFIHQEVT